MLILNPLEPWPGAARAAGLRASTTCRCWPASSTTAGSSTTTCSTRPARATATIARSAPPAGSTRAGARLERMRPIAERHGLTLLQLACQWTLAQRAVASVVPTLIQEPGADARPVEAKRAELAALPREVVLTDDEVAEIAAIGDNAGCMTLKGGSPDARGRRARRRVAARRRPARDRRALGHRARARPRAPLTGSLAARRTAAAGGRSGTCRPGRARAAAR